MSTSHACPPVASIACLLLMNHQFRDVIYNIRLRAAPKTPRQPQRPQSLADSACFLASPSSPKSYRINHLQTSQKWTGVYGCRSRFGTGSSAQVSLGPNFSSIPVLGVPLPQLLASVYNYYDESNPPLGHRVSTKLGWITRKLGRTASNVRCGTTIPGTETTRSGNATPLGDDFTPFGLER